MEWNEYVDEDLSVNGLVLPAQLIELMNSGCWQHPGDQALRDLMPWFEDPLDFLTSINRMRRESRSLIQFADDSLSAQLFRATRGSTADLLATRRPARSTASLNPPGRTSRTISTATLDLFDHDLVLRIVRGRFVKLHVSPGGWMRGTAFPRPPFRSVADNPDGMPPKEIRVAVSDRGRSVRSRNEGRPRRRPLCPRRRAP
jgi:hypothetical protein